MPITKATQNVITPKIVTTDTRQTITGEKVISLNYSGTSTTTLTFALGTQTLTTNTGLDFKSGDGVKIGRFASLTTSTMTGTVTSYNSSTGVLVANITSENSSGTFSSWFIGNTNASPALLITQTGEGDALKVEDSQNPDASPFRVTATGSVVTGGSITIGGTGTTNLNVQNASITSYGNGWKPSVPDISQAGLIDLIQTNKINSLSFRNQKNAINVPVTANNYSEVFNLADSLNLYLPFQDQLGSSFTNSNGFTCQLQVRILVYVFTTTVSTGQVVQTLGSYLSPVFVVNPVTNSSNFTGFTLNGVTTGTNITTVEGLSQSAGGVPANGYATIQATAATTTAHGAVNLILRGHTTADSATTTYASYLAVELITKSLLGS